LALGAGSFDEPLSGLDQLLLASKLQVDKELSSSKELQVDRGRQKESSKFSRRPPSFLPLSVLRFILGAGVLGIGCREAAGVARMGRSR